MPERLYRDDAYLTRFTATVTAAGPGDGGLLLELDRTAFYPTGGGQPHDTGVIAGLPVADVREAGGGRIVHLARPPEAAAARGAALVAAGGTVECAIDWPRRFDHMQQHTGQHILSRAFVEQAGAATRSFHLGEATCTIDLDRPDLGEAAVRAAETLANSIVFGDAPVTVDLADPSRAPELAADMNLARELALKPGDPIRIIRIEGFDETPCGGTHVRRAGEVGCVAIRSHERFKGGTRVTFACGGRAVRLMAGLGAVVDDCVARLSAPPDQIGAAVGRLQEQLADARRAARTLNEALAGAEAIARDASARSAGGGRVIVEVFPDRAAEDLQLLAQKYVLSGSRVALLAAVETASGRATLVFARSDEGLPESLKMGEILSAVCRAHDGRGGGAAGMARGGVPAPQAAACLEEAFALVAARLHAR